MRNWAVSMRGAGAAGGGSCAATSSCLAAACFLGFGLCFFFSPATMLVDARDLLLDMSSELDPAAAVSASPCRAGRPQAPRSIRCQRQFMCMVHS